MAELEFDVLIVGSGAGGGMTALSLCQQGFKVGLIERGPKFEPTTDYIQNYADWETRRDPLKLAREREQSIDQRYRAPSSGNARPAFRSPLRYSRVHGVGGTTLHYQGEAHRFAAHAFEQGKQQETKSLTTIVSSPASTNHGNMVPRPQLTESCSF